MGANTGNKAWYLTVKDWKEKHGYWIPHPLYPLGDWMSEVANSDTRQGYWDWAAKLEEESDHESLAKD